LTKGKRAMGQPVPHEALDILFRHARTHRRWLDKPVTDELLRAIWDLARLPPTSANSGPLRVVFVRSADAKEKLRPALSSGNMVQTMSAPVTAVFAYDTLFHDQLPRLYPAADARSWFAGNPDLIEETAFRNGTLGAAYFMLAARALGLDVGPMSGFDRAGVDRVFFSDGRLKSNFLCNLGYGSGEGLRPRAPRLDFDEACRIE